MRSSLRRALSTTKEPLWRPSRERAEASQLSAFADGVAARHGGDARGAGRLRPAAPGRLRPAARVACARPDAFWDEVWKFVDFRASAPYADVVAPRERRGSTRALADAARARARERAAGAELVRGRAREPRGEPARARARRRRGDRLRERDGRAAARALVRRAARARVGALSAALRDTCGVRAGDRVAGYIPSTPDAVVAMLAATALGASYASVSPDFGARGAVDRLAQVAPKVLFVADRYHYRGRRFEMAPRLAEIAPQLPSVERTVVFDYDAGADARARERRRARGRAGRGRVGARARAAAAGRRGGGAAPPPPPAYAPMPFDAPVYTMFSSGTTRKPKCMVQGTGVLLNVLKECHLHFDVRRGDRVFWFTTTGWMMWNWLVANLGTGATVVLRRRPALRRARRAVAARRAPPRDALWHVRALALGVRVRGRRGEPRARGRARRVGARALGETVRVIGSTGSPASGNIFQWVYNEVRADGDVHFVSTSGGTDLNGSFVGGNPWLPVYEDELQSPLLGLDVAVLDPDTGVELARGAQGERARASPSRARARDARARARSLSEALGESRI